MNADNPLSVISLLSIEGVMKHSRFSLLPQTRQVILKTIDTAVDKLIVMRKKEGKALDKDIANSVQVIKKCADNIKILAKNEVNIKFEKLKTRLIELAGSSAETDNRLITELAILTDKLDVNEELVRLYDHIEKIKSVMKVESSGKHIDFIAQERFREINTIGSKSNKSEISHICVEVKNHIDKIREQSRNIV